MVKAHNLESGILCKVTVQPESVVFDLFVRVLPDVNSLQLCTPKVADVLLKLYITYNLHLK
jgi:hypothetical protein